VIDDLRVTTYSISTGANAADNSENVRINVMNDNIVMQCQGKNTYQVFSSTGQLIQSGEFNDYKSLKTDAKGMIIVKIGSYVKKALVW
jgi:hypothetical protein